MSDSVIERVAKSRSPSIGPSRSRAVNGPNPRAGGAAAVEPIPFAPILPGIFLPQDHYLHRDAPAEWWWHTGTLKTDAGRTFGFEINAASFQGRGFGFTQVMLTDVDNQVHYQRTTPYLPPLTFEGSHWAEFDVTRDWYVNLGTPLNCLSTIIVTSPGKGYASAPKVEITNGGLGIGADAVAVLGEGDTAGMVIAVALLSPGLGYTQVPTITLTGGGGTGATAQALHTFVTMSAPWPDPSQNMKVNALLNDEVTGTEVRFDLSMSQYGPPFLVWSTGVAPIPDTHGGHLDTNLYYYSLTRMRAMGTITFGGQVYPVKGVTWMDHEYGAFGNGSGGSTPTWILQDMQLDNGYCISNSISIAENPGLGVPIDTNATVQADDGTTVYVPSRIIMTDGWPDPQKGPYSLTIQIEIPAFDARLTVQTLMPDQLFPMPGDAVYEGVATASGVFQGRQVIGTAWNEQALPPPNTEAAR